VLNGGLAGDDLDGGAGNDTLTGGSDAKDTYWFTAGLDRQTNVDTITDFTANTDLILLAKSVFVAITAGEIASGAFFAGGAAHNAHEHIIYRPASGNPFYDANGNGAGGLVQFAHLGMRPTLSVHDFAFI